TPGTAYTGQDGVRAVRAVRPSATPRPPESDVPVPHVHPSVADSTTRGSAGDRPPLRTRLRAYVALTKPRIIELLLITTEPTMILAAGGFPSWWLIIATLVGGAAAARSEERRGGRA